MVVHSEKQKLPNGIAFGTYGGTMRCPKTQVKMFFSRDSFFMIFWNAPKSKRLIFGSY